MKFCLLLLLFVAYVAVTLGQSCSSKIDCPGMCPDGYHKDCLSSGTCGCPEKSCTVADNCPIGHESGCPPGSKTECKDGKCICHRSTIY